MTELITIITVGVVDERGKHWTVARRINQASMIAAVSPSALMFDTWKAAAERLRGKLVKKGAK
jgi:hypothetical protein